MGGQAELRVTDGARWRLQKVGGSLGVCVGTLRDLTRSYFPNSFDNQKVTLYYLM